MATTEYPEAIRLRRELEKSRKKSSFKDADFRHGSLLQNIMEALSELMRLAICQAGVYVHFDGLRVAILMLESQFGAQA